MASLSTGSNGSRKIQWLDNGKRRTVYLGKIPKRTAEQTLVRIEHLLASKVTGAAPDAETSRWVSELGDELHGKLAAAGLVESRVARADETLGPFLEHYLNLRTDVKAATRTVWRHAVRNAKEHFGADTLLKSISEGDVEEFKLKLLDQKLTSSTVNKRLQVLRSFFAAAKRRRLLESNPFDGQNVREVIKQDRYYLSREDTLKLLAEAPDVGWRTTIALARFAGLRTPSETHLLKWEHVSWSENAIMIPVKKLEHLPDKAWRRIPIFGELRPYLEEAFHDPQADPEYVVRWVGDRGRNLRTRFAKIILRAGLKPWPKQWQTLRWSCEADLNAVHPGPAVLAWIGHEESVAKKHYWTVRPEDHERAVRGDAEYDAVAAQKATQQAFARSRTDSQTANLNPVAARDYASPCEGVREHAKTRRLSKVAEKGLEPPTHGL
jgi:hypothetical protein